MGKLSKSKEDEHYSQLLQEIAEEVKLGRMSGPYRAPPEWGFETVAPEVNGTV